MLQMPMSMKHPILRKHAYMTVSHLVVAGIRSMLRQPTSAAWQTVNR
jgi:hypothetical protein